MKIDRTILTETRYIALWVLIFSALMQAIFLVANVWNYTVILGNLLGAFFAVFNFFLMGISVQKALAKEEKEAKNTMRASMLYRNFMLLAVAAVGALVSVFNIFSVIIPFFFPRIAIAIRPLFKKS